MTRTVKLKIDQWDIFLEATFEVNDDVFTEDVATEVNTFWSSDDDRLDQCDGNVKMAALKLYAQQCFELAAFNNFLNAEWVMSQFDWQKGKGVEGFPSFEQAGLRLVSIDNLHIDFDWIEVDA